MGLWVKCRFFPDVKLGGDRGKTREKIEDWRNGNN